MKHLLKEGKHHMNKHSITTSDIGTYATATLASSVEAKKNFRKSLTMTAMPLTSAVWFHVTVNGKDVCETRSLQEAITEYNKH